MAEANFIIRARDRSRDAIASADARLAKLQGRMKTFGMGGMSRFMGPAGIGMAAAAMVAYGRASLKTADNIDNMSQRMRLGLESVQSMDVLMRQAGMSGEQFGSVMDRLVQSMDKANNGNQAAIDSFSALGVNMADLAKMTPEQALEAVTKALHENQGNSRTAAAATDVLGTRSTRLNHVLNQLGAQGFSGLNAHMLATAQIMEGDMVRAGDRMEEGVSRAFTRMSNKAKTLAIRGMAETWIAAKSAFTSATAEEVRNELFGEMPRLQIGTDIAENIEQPIVSAAEKASDVFKQSMDQFSSADLVNRAQRQSTERAEKQRDEMLQKQSLTIAAIQSLSLSPINP